MSDNLSDYEKHGYKLASAWLQLGVKPGFIRPAVVAALYNASQTPIPRHFNDSWWCSIDEHRKGAKASPDSKWGVIHAAMAGVELAIKEHG